MLPEISVVIPTHNRRDSVMNALRALARQSLPPERFEVIVVADGCSDDTVPVLQASQWPFPLTVVDQPASRAGAARNRGAASARGELLAFMDDDIEPCPEWLEMHQRAHQDRPQLVSVGYLVTPAEPQESMFQIELRYWWEAMFFPLRHPGYRFQYTNLTSGNFSIRRDLFDEVGGFRTNLMCHEDYELGYRLISGQAELYYNQAAWAFHHDRTRLERIIQRKREEGIDDARLGNWYPELLPVLSVTKLYRAPVYTFPLILFLTFQAPLLMQALMAGVRMILRGLEALRLRNLWRLTLDTLLIYGYAWGLKDELGSYSALKAFRRQQRPLQPTALLDLDLARGLPSAARLLDERRPDSLRLFYGAQLLGEFPPKPGAELWQGRHLTWLLLDPALNLVGKLPSSALQFLMDRQC